MRLTECLSNASVKTLRSIIKTQNLEASMHSKHDMLQTILYEMRVPSHTSDQFEKWYAEWGTVLTRIALTHRCRFSAEEMSALFYAHGHNQDALDRALCEGWLFARREVSMRPEFLVPDDVHDQLRTYAISSIRSQVVERHDDPLVQRYDGEAMVRDLHTLLDYIANHDVQITTEGAMYKRHLQKLMEVFELSEDLDVPKWRFGYGRRTNDYPDRLALLYDFAYHKGLIIETDNERLQVAKAEFGWGKQSHRSQLQQLLKFYLTLYRKPIPRLREIVEVIRIFRGTWVSSQTLLTALGELVTPFYYDDRDAVWQNRIVHMLANLGMIRIGQDENLSEVWFQITKLGQELLSEDEMDLVDAKQSRQPCLIVQPNFEIMVTVHDGQLEKILAQFSELKTSGSLRIYRILERTVNRGLESGYDMDSWVLKMTEHSFGPMPGNVERTLREWSKMKGDSNHRPLSS